MTEIEIILKKADLLLKSLKSIEIAGIDVSGYPHIFEMEVMTNSNVKTINFTTGIYSDKVNDFKNNNKAGVSFCLGTQSISLIGQVTIIEETEEKRSLWNTDRTKHLNDSSKEKLYCILQFSTEVLYYYFDGEKGFFRL